MILGIIFAKSVKTDGEITNQNNKKNPKQRKKSKQVYQGGIMPHNVARDIYLFDFCDIFSTLLFNLSPFLSSKPLFLKLRHNLI